jgi:hypothetical protein
MSSNTRRGAPGAIALLATMVIALPLAGVIGQQRVQGGRALDYNLRLGSGGYNRRPASPNYMPAQRYTPGQTKPLYTVNRYGDLSYSPSNAFMPKSRYSATGYQATYQSPGWHQRFRYQDQY